MRSGFLSPFICKDYNSPVSFSLLISSDAHYFEVCVSVRERKHQILYSFSSLSDYFIQILPVKFGLDESTRR